MSGALRTFVRATVLALGLVLALGRPVTAGSIEGPVYLVSHGWHVGLAMRREELRTVAPLLDAGFQSFPSLEFGWGDCDYYPARRGTIRLALRAAFDSRCSVLQVVGVSPDVPDMFPRAKVLRVDLSPAGLEAVARYIADTLELDPQGRPIVVAPAEYGFGFFYLARGRYRLLDNSNTWTAAALYRAGCPIDVDASATAGAVLHQAARFARVVRPGVFLHAHDERSLACGPPRDDMRRVERLGQSR